ncbi:MAG: phosphopantothenoylcysteine decarboxylase [Patescibacteria group bacterium]|nr:phosphopantothenoylcysteine decarboxylase [Patescibacteria group bacterium]
MKRMLVTAGSTATHIDKVRIVTNIFGGRTGENIAIAAREDGWDVTILSSNREFRDYGKYFENFRRIRFKTFDELAELMEREVREGGYDAIVHSAAVSDYRPEGIYVRDVTGSIYSLNISGSDAAKIPSSHRELFVRLVPTFKIIDRIRDPWDFQGKLVKFKLQVDMTDEQLVEIAQKSIVQSDADIIVANCLEWSTEYAYIIGRDDDDVNSVVRKDLATELIERLS